MRKERQRGMQKTIYTKTAMVAETLLGFLLLLFVCFSFACRFSLLSNASGHIGNAPLAEKVHYIHANSGGTQTTIHHCRSVYHRAVSLKRFYSHLNWPLGETLFSLNISNPFFPTAACMPSIRVVSAPAEPLLLPPLLPPLASRA